MRLGAQFEALLLERLLQPMERDFGALGSLAVGALAGVAAEADRNGFAGIVAAYVRSHE